MNDTTMLPIQTRSHRTSIPATGLGSILVASPQLALAGVDRGVVAEVAVAVGMGESSFTAEDRAPWADATDAPVATLAISTTADGTATVARQGTAAALGRQDGIATIARQAAAAAAGPQDGVATTDTARDAATTPREAAR